MDKKLFTVMIAGVANSGMEEYVRKNLIEIMQHSKSDKGCIIYNVHESISLPGEFMVYMVWEDEACFNLHNQKPEMQEFRKKLAPLWFEQQSPKTYWHIL